MSNEQKLLKKWHSLPPEKQQEVIDFVDFLTTQITLLNNQNSSYQSSLNPVIAEQV